MLLLDAVCIFSEKATRTIRNNIAFSQALCYNINKIEGVIPCPLGTKLTRQNGLMARDAYKE